MPIHEGVKSSGVLSSSAQVSASGTPALLYGYNLAAGTTATSVKFHDGGSGGTILWQDTMKAQTAAGDLTVNVTMPYAVVFTSDIYAEIAGTGATVTALYLPLK